MKQRALGAGRWALSRVRALQHVALLCKAKPSFSRQSSRVGPAFGSWRIALLIAALGTAAAFAAERVIEREPVTTDPLGPGLRGTVPLNEEPQAPRMARVENFDIKRGRAYTSQPPTIPHAIEKYEITRNVNFCMYCHARVRNAESQAPMVSATHFMDRDHNYLAEISPRRYFCTQCHVVQTDAVPLVENDFIDVHELIERAAQDDEGQRDARR